MRLIGVLGGMSWESTKTYYELMNEETARRLGGLASARILLSSVDFSRFAASMAAGDWDSIRSALVEEACRLKRGGAEALVVATNTMHIFAADMETAAGVPLLHIADAAAAAIARSRAAKVGLLGTRSTMEKDFYRRRLSEVHGIEAIVPGDEEKAEIDRIIFEELCRGRFLPGSRERLRAVARGLAERGAEGIVLGCTELPLAMKDGDLGIPYWDTTELHAMAAVDFMLGDAGAEAAPGTSR